MKRLIDDNDLMKLDHLICTPCDVEYNTFSKTPSSYNTINTFLSEVGIIRPVSKPDFDNMPFPLPPIEKQKQIARKLDKCNELILKNTDYLFIFKQIKCLYILLNYFINVESDSACDINGKQI